MDEFPGTDVVTKAPTNGRDMTHFYSELLLFPNNASGEGVWIKTGKPKQVVTTEWPLMTSKLVADKSGKAVVLCEASTTENTNWSGDKMVRAKAIEDRPLTYLDFMDPRTSLEQGIGWISMKLRFSQHFLH